MNDLQALETAFADKIAELKITYSAHTNLNATQKNAVSAEIDAVHETWNENLPVRSGS